MKKQVFCLIIMFFLFSNVVSASVVNPHQTYTYEKMKADIWELKKKYRKDLQVKTIGYSHFGRKIFAVKLGKGEKNILLIGAHHGREWLTSSLMMEMLETYTDAYHKNEKIGTDSSKLLDEVSIWFVPMLNPDGVTIQQNGINEFPKYHRDNLLKMNLESSDFTRWKANGMGVDLNRQYPTGWKKLVTDNITDPSYQFYKGKKPISTHETKSIVKFTKKIKPIIAVSYHTAGREIFWNYGNGENKQRDYMIASKAAELTGYDLAAPPENATGAGYTDWFISTFHQPALTIELSYLVGETNPPLNVFDEEWDRNKLLGMMLAKEAKNINTLK
ncbi:M14 family zinc carboxypeptidase [Bacillus sp. CGMCC 1.16607]|uniref:M14 family zinc carboxypeptidase n=1 Tax=Bacillus sp. CGMCC 1.16607 TaxID=3351842 RepID=UPI00362BB2FE